jgi:starvation-inducible DNA-binding protein
VENLTQLLTDTMTLRDLYQKHHWQLAGPTIYRLHALFDKHYEQQNESIDAIAERIQLLGGVSVAMPHDVVERTLSPRPPKGRDKVPAHVSRLLHAHENRATCRSSKRCSLGVSGGYKFDSCGGRKSDSRQHGHAAG